jgi:4-hydroxy-tetrahydrodipicolinate reductase
MKLALIGYGAMGQLVASQAQAAGDEIGIKLTSADSDRSVEDVANAMKGHDCAIDFSVASAVARNAEICARATVPLVEGTTGWKEDEGKVTNLMTEAGGSLIYGANFSIGVNVFHQIVQQAARLFAQLDQYAPYIEEQHHSRKRDAPSGTAIKLQNLMANSLERDVPIASTRAGFIPGTHRVGFDSAADQITLTHIARSREGFAAGALLAARWIVDRKGVYEFSEVIEQVLSAES